MIDKKDTVVVNKKRLREMMAFIERSGCCWDECPVWDICDNYETCQEALKAYLTEDV